MKITFGEFLPALRPWVQHLDQVWPAYIIKPQFASWEVLHILSLVILGGSAILMNLRLAGAGLTEESPSEVYRSLRRWQDAGVIGIIISGVLIGMANAERLYDSTAFVVKIVALISGIVLTYGASRPIARADGLVNASARTWFLVGAALWLLSVAIFTTAVLANPGLFHVLMAAAIMVLFLTRGRARLVFAAGLAVLVVGQIIVTHGPIPADDLARLDPFNKTYAVALALWIAGNAGREVFRPQGGGDEARLAKLVGYASILVWVTAAAAGRWIAFA
ncbi:MAG: hypothetical protein CFE28_14745 [Alphaproteobacteria bacterium PA2]|nr:MAG: hypothetical protein CFE28_14745 [Alphaproteobacteria bacterium PA2]